MHEFGFRESQPAVLCAAYSRNWKSYKETAAGPSSNQNFPWILSNVYVYLFQKLHNTLVIIRGRKIFLDLAARQKYFDLQKVVSTFCRLLLFCSVCPQHLRAGREIMAMHRD
jgi:hypothetical protein